MTVRRYVLSVPERTVRAATALTAGAVEEVTRVALPDAVRQAQLYQVTMGRLLRILVEGVGGVEGRYPGAAVPVGELAVRKTAGNVIELAGFLALGWSPLWLLAGASDVIGGSKAYLRALERELKADGLLAEDVSADSVDDLLGRLETTSGTLANAIDIPPTNVAEARQALDRLRAQAADLPGPGELGAIWTGLRETARQEGRSVGEVSAALGAAAARAGVGLGDAHVFGFYRDALREIGETGWLTYLRREASPYAARAVGHFRPGQTTYTDRLLERVGKSGGREVGGTEPPATA